ncbi:MAG: HAD family hydrolase [Proteobacteria bacterium]|nr:HAD family hydrolase [Pseudomonadota bacterium]
MPPGKLAIFDVDGTLVQSYELDGECFVAAFHEALGIADVDTDWARYDHVTDPGITAQIIHERQGREPSADDLVRLRSAFCTRLAEAASRDGAYAPLPGAAGLLAALRARADWTTALATGGWRAAARFKIGRSGLDLDDVPAAFGEDGPSRQGIVGAAIARAREHAGVDDFARMVCIGDGVWDLRTAAGLGLPCIGVGTGGRAERLAAAGATHVVPDFTDLEAIFNALENATPPWYSAAQPDADGWGSITACGRPMGRAESRDS